MEQLVELFNNIIDLATAGRDGVQQAMGQAGGGAQEGEQAPPGGGAPAQAPQG